MNESFEPVTTSFGSWGYGAPGNPNVVVQPTYGYLPMSNPGPSHPPGIPSSSGIQQHFMAPCRPEAPSSEPQHFDRTLDQQSKRKNRRKKTDRPLLDQIQTGNGPVVLYEEPYSDDPNDMYVPNGSFEETVPQEPGNVDEFLHDLEFEMPSNAESDEQPKKRRGPKNADSSNSTINGRPFAVDSSPAKGRVLKIGRGPFKGENSFYWESHPLEDRIKPPNCPISCPGPTEEAAKARTPLECFKLFLDDSIVDSIITHTNVEIEAMSSKYARKNDANLSPFAVDEFSAFLSLLILGGVLQNNHLRCETLFNPLYCGDQYRATMSVSRFQFIAGALTFDTPERNKPANKKDKLAPVENMWNKFLDNCKKHYVPSAKVTVGKQIVSYRGPCPFVITVHTPVVKHGMQMFLLVDNANKYMINALPYMGRDIFPSDASLGSFVVNKLIEPIKGSWRTVTMDEWFTTISLAQELLEESQLTVIGQIKKNRKELPAFFVDSKFKQRKNGSSLFLHNKDVTAVSYKPCNNTGLILVISTCNYGNSLREKTKPEVICEYEATRGAVEALESLCERTNVSRKSLKWQCAFFFNMLNVALHNAYVIYCHNWAANNPNVPKSRMMQRTDFAFSLVSDLSRTWMQVRLGFCLPKGLRLLIKRCLKMEEDHDTDTSTQDPSPGGDAYVLSMSYRKTCNICPTAIKRRTRFLCCFCSKPICNEHARRMCVTCHQGRGGREDDATPKKMTRKKSKTSSPDSSDEVESVVEEDEEWPIPKKTKKKSKKQSPQNGEAVDRLAVVRPPKKKRGRPRKHAQPEETSSQSIIGAGPNYNLRMTADDLIEEVEEAVREEGEEAVGEEVQRSERVPLKRRASQNLAYLLELEYSSSENEEDDSQTRDRNYEESDLIPELTDDSS